MSEQKTLKEKINTDLVVALKSRNELEVSVLRMMISAVRNKEISMRDSDKVELSDEQVLEVLGYENKKRKDSIFSYEHGGRPDLAKKEKSEMEIISRYLPEELSDDEIKKIIEGVISELSAGPGDFGKVMGKTVGMVKGRADGQRVSALVKEILK